jgi:hypothetical protein
VRRRLDRLAGWLGWCRRCGEHMIACVAMDAGGVMGARGGDGQRCFRRACGAGYPMYGSNLSQRLRAEVADQCAGGGVSVGHLGYPFPSPALFNQIEQRFRRAVRVAQEFQRVWTAYERQTPTKAVQWWFTNGGKQLLGAASEVRNGLGSSSLSRSAYVKAKRSVSSGTISISSSAH